MNRKEAYDVTKYPQKMLDKLNSIKSELKVATSGIFGDPIPEPVAKHNRSEGEVIFENENGSSIILGRDRTGSKESGYGGKGHTQCASIDISVGHGLNKQLYDEGENRVDIDPDFVTDSARVYISQKCDIDEAFNLATGSYGQSKTKSAIALKADDIRLISRENMKLIAGIDELNSQGGNRRAYYGIELIANNDDKDLQSIPKGENLVKALREIVEHVDDLAGILEILIRNQMAINSVLMAHMHISSAPGTPTSPSIELATTVIPANAEIASRAYSGLLIHKVNSAFLKVNNLMKFGSNFINSKFNKVN